MSKEIIIYGFEDLARYIIGKLDLLDGIQSDMADIKTLLGQIDTQGKNTMALSDQEISAINDLKQMISTVTTDVDTAMTGAAATSADLKKQIDDLTATRDALEAKDVADEGLVSSLTDTINAMKVTEAAHETDVVNALTGITSTVKALDGSVSAVAAPPVAPPDLSGGVPPVTPTPGAAPPDLSGGTVPTPAPVVEPAPAPVVEPTPAPVVEPIPAPVVEPTPAPVVAPIPVPVFEPAPVSAPVVEPTPAPVVAPIFTPTPVVEPATPPVVEPTPVIPTPGATGVTATVVDPSASTLPSEPVVVPAPPLA